MFYFDRQLRNIIFKNVLIIENNCKSIFAYVLSQKYGYKLEILDTLLCLRDEYNNIDGFEEGFRFEEENFCIENFDGKLALNISYYSSKLMHFGKEESAKLFFKNFEKQLEIVKEFL